MKLITLKFFTLVFLISLLSACDTTPVAPKAMVFIHGETLKTVIPHTDTPNEVEIEPFFIDKYLVTYEAFKTFATRTNYMTEAEKYGNSVNFNPKTGAWEITDGINYHHPNGPNESILGPDHPATHISWNDAKHYCECQDKRLPTDAEWELAAKNGEGSYSKQYAWGEKSCENGEYKANYWQGSFPSYNSKKDGFQYTSPVGYFGSTSLGLYDMGGNVWQWCSDDIAPTPEELAMGDPAMRKVLRGGSFLCDPAICHGFRAIGRSSSTPETGSCHVGFRCVKDVKK